MSLNTPDFEGMLPCRLAVVHCLRALVQELFTD
jgi:hypothetical protein